MLDRRRVTDFRSLRIRVYFRFSFHASSIFFRASRIPFRLLFCDAPPLVAGGQRDEIGGFDGRGAEELDRPRLFHAHQDLERKRGEEEELSEK